MSEEEYMECSVVAYPRQIKFLHINGGAISYYVDRHVSDYVDRLQKENQELKKQLHEASIEMQEMIEQDIECPSNCSKLKELKKQLEETNGMIEKCGFVNIEQVMLSYCGLITKQKEFIKWLEDEKDILAKGCSDICKDKFEEVDDILQQYKKIIGE